MKLRNFPEQFRLRRALLGAVLAITLMVPAAAIARAQSFTGSISGTVTDPAGAVIPNATVTLTAVDTGRTRTATTNGAGEYNFPSLPPGAYKVRVTAKNFTTSEISAQLVVAQQLRADAQLKIGVESETVEISAGEGGVAVETQNAQLSNVVNQEQIVNRRAVRPHPRQPRVRRIPERHR